MFCLDLFRPMLSIFSGLMGTLGNCWNAPGGILLDAFTNFSSRITGSLAILGEPELSREERLQKVEMNTEQENHKTATVRKICTFHLLRFVSSHQSECSQTKELKRYKNKIDFNSNNSSLMLQLIKIFSGSTPLYYKYSARILNSPVWIMIGELYQTCRPPFIKHGMK